MPQGINLTENLRILLKSLDDRLTKIEQSRFFRAPVISGSPRIPADGDTWIDSTTNRPNIRVNGNTWPLAQAQSDTGWIAPTLLNSWVNYDTSAWQGAGYRLDAQGFVHLKGLVKSGTAGSNPIFTLPAGYRPALRCIFSCTGNVTTEGWVRVDVLPNGQVLVTNPGGTYQYLSLDGLCWLAEQ